MNVSAIAFACILLFCPILSHAAVWLEDRSEKVMECQGEEKTSGWIACQANTERLATYAKCHRQMKDAMELMNQFLPLHSEDEAPVAQTIPQDQQDKAITYWRQTLQRCGN